MLNYLIQDLPLHIFFFQAIMILILLSNIRILRRARQHARPLEFPKVSVLIPARNEENNIERCVQSLLLQDYPNFEVIVLDDQSSDSTKSILKKMAMTAAGLHMIEGRPLPDGWMGKSWACTQLAEKAQGDLFYFTDADTVHQPDALTKIVMALLGEQADFITGFPHQEMHTWGERLIVPFFTWAFYTFLPLWMAYQMRFPALSNAIGQMMLFRRDAYQAIGGHGGVSDQITEDLELAKKIKAAGLRWRVMNAFDLIACRMYHTNQEAVEGFSRNLFAAFGFRVLPFLFVFVWLLMMFWEPLIVLALFALGFASQAQPAILVGCIVLAVITWLVPLRQLGLASGLAFLYPLIILVNAMIAFRSMHFSLTGQLAWKNRKLARPKWRWL